MAPVAALGEVDVGARVGVDVGDGVGVVPLVELLPQATSNTTSTRLLKAIIVPFDTFCNRFNIRNFFLHFVGE